MATITLNKQKAEDYIIYPIEQEFKKASERLDGFVRLEAKRNRRTIKRAMRKSTYRNNKWK